MAVDTRDKRVSIVAVSSPWRGILPTPDGSVSAADRQIILYYYSGVAFGAPPVGGGGNAIWYPRIRRRRR